MMECAAPAGPDAEGVSAAAMMVAGSVTASVVGSETAAVAGSVAVDAYVAEAVTDEVGASVVRPAWVVVATLGVAVCASVPTCTRIWQRLM